MKRNYDREKARAYRLQRTYGITTEQYESLLASQGGVCALCGKSSEEEGVALAVDHDHITLEVRGILCNYCNRRIVGRHRDADLLRRVADYLDRSTGWFVPKKKRVRKPRKAKSSG